VALLLVAFVLNLFGFVSQSSRAYQLLNTAGAAVTCYASILIGFVPFVVLEAIWCAAGVVALVRPRPVSP
jgi:hypothetical protein